MMISVCDATEPDPSTLIGFLPGQLSQDGNKEINASIVSVNDDNQDGNKKRKTTIVPVNDDKQGGSSNKDKAIAIDVEDNDLVEVMTNKTAKRNYRRGNPSLTKRTRTPKNPYKCPDMEYEDWGSAEHVQYKKWLQYEKRTRFLTRDEQDYLVTQGVSGVNLGNRKISF